MGLSTLTNCDIETGPYSLVFARMYDCRYKMNNGSQDQTSYERRMVEWLSLRRPLVSVPEPLREWRVERAGGGRTDVLWGYPHRPDRTVIVHKELTRRKDPTSQYWTKSKKNIKECSIPSLIPGRIDDRKLGKRLTRSSVSYLRCFPSVLSFSTTT